MGHVKRWSRNGRALAGLGLLLLHLTAAAQGQTPAQAHIETALRHYQDLEYELALEELHSAQRRARTPAETGLTMLYEGIVLFELGQDEEATAAFQAALRLQPGAALPMKVSPKIAQRFESLKQQVMQGATEQPPKAPQKAPEEVAGADSPKKPRLDPPGSSLDRGPRIPMGSEQPEVEESASQPWFKRWYVWAGVGAVVTAAAVGTVMATQKSSLSQNDVCGGTCDGALYPIVRF
jgi:hypothetical protein